MEYEIMPYTEADVDAMIEIWNEVVRDGAAFPQLDELNHMCCSRQYFQSCHCVT